MYFFCSSALGSFLSCLRFRWNQGSAALGGSVSIRQGLEKLNQNTGYPPHKNWEKKTSKWVLPQIAEQKRCNWIMKMFPLIAIFDGFVHAPRQNTVSTSVFCCDATRQCKYQRFGLQHAKSIMQKASCKKRCFVEIAMRNKRKWYPQL